MARFLDVSTPGSICRKTFTAPASRTKRPIGNWLHNVLLARNRMLRGNQPITSAGSMMPLPWLPT